jgi:PIN domain nuclease of toxin-antitoxin system
MRLLLDTHTLVWWAQDSSLLSEAAHSAIDATTNQIVVSAVSGYEAAYKHAIGKWPEVESLVAQLPIFLAQQNFEALPITMIHSLRAARLPLEHRDPFDRMIAAQALSEGLEIVSIDDKLDQFGVRRLW